MVLPRVATVSSCLRRAVPAQAASVTARKRVSSSEPMVVLVACGLSAARREFHSSSILASVSPAGKEGGGYVSPHDWNKLKEAYGKPRDTEAAAAAVEIQTIRVQMRTLEEQGSRYSRKIRERGLLPGVLYGPGVDGDKRRMLVTVSRFEIEKQMRRLGDSLESTVFDVDVDDGKYKQRVILRDLDRDPATTVPRSINFIRYRPGMPVRVPVCFVNEELCVPIKRGGLLLSINRFIPVTCDRETIPEMLLADLAGAYNSEKIDLKRVTFPPGVQPYRLPPGFFLGVIKGKGSLDKAVTAGAAEGEEQEAG